MKTAAQASKVTIRKATGVGVLTKAADGKWDIELNGQKGPANLHYDDAAVDRIIAASVKAGDDVTVE